MNKREAKKLVALELWVANRLGFLEFVAKDCLEKVGTGPGYDKRDAQAAVANACNRLRQGMDAWKGAVLGSRHAMPEAFAILEFWTDIEKVDRDRIRRDWRALGAASRAALIAITGAPADSRYVKVGGAMVDLHGPDWEAISALREHLNRVHVRGDAVAQAHSQTRPPV